jgi:hypothetical protein
MLERRIADREDIAGHDVVAGDLRKLRRDVEALSARVDAVVLEAERGARSGVGGVAGAEGVAVAPIGVGMNVDRHEVGGGIRRARPHLEVGEVLRVVERELSAQHLCQVEGIALVVTQVAPYQALLHDLLGDGGRAEAVALAGLKLERDARRVIRRIHQQLVARELGVEVAVGGGGALQVGLDAVVGRLVETLAGLERRMREDAPEERIALAGAGHFDLDARDQHRPPRLDIEHDAPLAPAEIGDGGAHLRLEVAVRAQRLLHLALDPVVQPLDHVGVQVDAAFLVALEAQVCEHVGAQRLVDAAYFDVDAGGAPGCGREPARESGEQAHEERRASPVP